MRDEDTTKAPTGASEPATYTVRLEATRDGQKIAAFELELESLAAAQAAFSGAQDGIESAINSFDGVRLGHLETDGWAGRLRQRVLVVKETPHRYRIKAPIDKQVRLPRGRTLTGDETAMVPKSAITFEAQP